MTRTNDFSSRVPAIWLRDNCPCSQCSDALSGQKLSQVRDLAHDVSATIIDEDADTVTVSFAPGGHRATFSRSWLDEHTHIAGRTSDRENEKRLWRTDDLCESSQRTIWSHYRSSDDERLRVLRSIRRRGFAVIHDTPTSTDTVIDVVATFGFVRETNYGKLFNVRVDPEPRNLAFTSHAISPHTDNPYRDPVPTLQLLHCLSNTVKGGDSGLVDGFMAASILREENPRYFEVLSTTPVEFAWNDQTTSLRAKRTLIEVDECVRVRGVRFNNRSMQALCLAYDELIEFYDAYRRFADIIADPGLEYAFRLAPGDCLIMDNTRLLHSRSAFDESGSGSRHLQGCYSDVDGLASTIEVLERRQLVSQS
ncbi:MAG TPA: TauD/TfdA family dioxygenase [Acidimicrobiales bacterium]|jgi:gamma-butyrobetaine dioxygenase|nr:TauD/TfdA family dioxygenase [Acidimicrobiales bacterium]